MNQLILGYLIMDDYSDISLAFLSMWKQQTKNFLLACEQGLKSTQSEADRLNDHHLYYQWWQESQKHWQQYQQEFFSSFNDPTVKNHEQNSYFHDYQNKQAKWLAKLSELNMNASELFSIRLQKLALIGEMLQNFHQFYEMWIECCESCYQDLLKNDEYQKILGEYMMSLFLWKVN